MPNDPTPAPAPAPSPAPAPAPAPSPSPSPAPAAFDWTTHVSDEATRGWVSSKGFKDPAALAQTALNQEKLLGVPADQIIKLPKDLAAAKPEELGAIYDRLGRPAKPEEYGLPVPEGDKGEFAGTASKWFHEAGLSGKQGRAVAEAWNKHVAETQKAQGEAVKARELEQGKALREAWGPQYDANVKLVDAAAATFGMTKEQLVALKGSLGEAGAMKFLHGIGSKLGVEGDFKGGEGGKTGGQGGRLTPEQAQTQIAAKRADKAWTARFAKGDSEARNEMRELHRQAYPGDTVI